MHATHQFFLNHRSVYLLVLDSRQNERQSRIDYWLRLIASYGGDSPVIVVCNKADQQVMQLNWTGLQREYPQIKAYTKEISCYQHGGEDRRKGIEELKAQIARAVEQEVAEVDRPILERWLDFKDALEKDGAPLPDAGGVSREGSEAGHHGPAGSGGPADADAPTGKRAALQRARDLRPGPQDRRPRPRTWRS